MSTIESPTLADLSFLTYLKEEGYMAVRPFPGRKWAAVKDFMYTHAIIVGRMGDWTGYDDRWCYSSAPKAMLALEAWNGEGEPTGWHRHPDSGRRRTDGDPATERVWW